MVRFGVVMLVPGVLAGVCALADLGARDADGWRCAQTRGQAPRQEISRADHGRTSMSFPPNSEVPT